MNKDLKCPKCGSEMEKGYIKILEGIRWRTEDKSRGELLKWGNPFWPRTFEGYICMNCRILLLSY
jgi:DNA-directed RNA polymerase subunit RPC12/RpoP